MKPLRLALVFVYLAAASCAQNAPGAPAPASPNLPAPSAAPGKDAPGVIGTITEIGAGTFTLKSLDARSVTVTLGDQTQFRKDRKPAKLGDFRVGDVVMVRGESTGVNALAANLVAARTGSGQGFREGLGKRFIAGVIQSIDGTRLTIERIDGVTQTISADETTSFRKEGESITLADVHPGDHIVARGELKDGIFVPATLLVGGAPWLQRGARGRGPDSR